MKRRFWFAAAVTVPLVILAMGDMLPGQPISRLLSARVRTFAELLLATPVCIWAAWPFYVRAVQSVKDGMCPMQVEGTAGGKSTFFVALSARASGSSRAK